MTHMLDAFLRSLALPAAAILVFAGCAEQPPRVAPACPACVACPQCPAPARPAEARYQQTPFAAIPGWQDAMLAPGVRAFAAGCPRIARSHPLKGVCDSALGIAPDDERAARQFVEESFAAWEVASGEGAAEGLITGYYEPVLAGSRARSDRFPHPV